MKTNPSLAATILLTLFASPGYAQDVPPLPAICGTPAGDMASSMGMAGHSAPGDATQPDLATGMDELNGQMMQAMELADIDVAFVCAMIPHHQAAINMARAELAQGDDPWAKTLAQKVIDAQQAEIDEMRAWLAEKGD